MPKLTTLRTLAVCTLTATLMLGQAAQAQTVPVGDASVQTIIQALGGHEPQSKAFRRTAAPDADTHACPEVMANSGAVGSKNLIVVYASNAPSFQMDIQFANNSDRIPAGNRALLNNLALALNSNELAHTTMALAGHTDAVGPRAANLQLSCARAIAVRNYLIGQGVAAERLGAYGFGPDRPLDNRVQSTINRRVEIRRAN